MLIIRMVIIAALVGLFAAMPAVPTAEAQGGDTTQALGDTTIHVVQRGESLFDIATRYGTTVEAIAAANGITDPRYLAAGQRLLIPYARSGSPGALVTHVVQPGDSLETIARAYLSTPQVIAASNYVTNPALLYVGEELTIHAGVVGSPAYHIQALDHAAAADNVFRLALQYQVGISQLVHANGLLSSAGPIFAGQHLRIPGGRGGAELADLPAPFAACTAAPVPLVQGNSFSLRLKTEVPATLEGVFMDQPIRFATEDGIHHYAVVGVHAFTAAGVYPLTIEATAGAEHTVLALRVRVNDGNYGAETISLNADQQDLLDTGVTEPEWVQIATTMSGFSERRYFNGLMGLPSSGAITSQYGTRRSYNEGQLRTFHSGTDFGGGPGTDITAPAAGMVVLVDTFPVRGNATVIDHGWGVYTGYWHQSEVFVQPGDFVTAGQVIGTVGNTGRSTGPHLHWEMWVNGVQVDPMQWVQQSFP